jgi:hypothetical protein
MTKKRAADTDTNPVTIGAKTPFSLYNGQGIFTAKAPAHPDTREAVNANTPRVRWS